MKAAPTRRISRDIFSLQGSRSTGVVHMGHGSTAKIHPRPAVASMSNWQKMQDEKQIGV